MKKQTKIIISVVLSCTFLLLLFIPSFASDDTVLIKAGTYKWNDTPNLDGVDFTVIECSIPFTVNFSEEGEFYSIPFDGIGAYGGSEFPTLQGIAYSSNDIVGVLIVYTPSGGWDSELSTYAQTITITEDTYVPSSISVWLNSNLDSLDYEGNPFSDIMNLIIEALDVPLFGSFSLWDMLTTICGLFAVVWLLKLLAGG